MASDLERILDEERDKLARREADAVARMLFAYERTVDGLLQELTALTRQIAERRQAGLPVTENWLRRQARYVRLIEQADALYAQFADDGGHLLDQARLEAAGMGGVAGAAMLGAVGISFAGNINAPAMARLTAAMAPGSPLVDVLTSYGRHGRAVIADELIKGMGEGRGLREIERRIRKRLLTEATPRLETLVRTESMRAYRGSLMDQYAGYVDEWMWSAHLSDRTCLACLALHGTTYPIKDKFMPSHPRCRCSPTPVPRRRFGPPPQSGEDWFRQQDAVTQRRMLPTAESYQAYRDGAIRLADFVGYDHDPVWGMSVRERSGRQVMAEVGA